MTKIMGSPFGTMVGGQQAPVQQAPVTVGNPAQGGGYSPWGFTQQYADQTQGIREGKKQGFFSGEHKDAKRARNETSRDLKDYGKAQAEWNKAMGYDDYTPYQYNQNAFNNPYLNASKGMLAEKLASREGVMSPQMQAAMIDPTQQAQFRDYQTDLLAQLQGQATGQGDSLAQLQLQQGLDQGLSQQRAFAASQGGVSPALAQRQASMAGSDLAGQTNMAAAQTRLAEQMQAQQMLAGVAAQGRQSDLDLAGGQAQLMQQASMANQQAALEHQKQLDAATQYYLDRGLGLESAQWAANMQLEQLRGEQHRGAQGDEAKVAAAEAGKQGGGGAGLAGSLLGGLGGLLGFISDKNKKTKIAKAKNEFYNFLEKMNGYSYEYKDQDYSKGKKFGVMTQDLEKSEVGKTLVKDTPIGKMVDSNMGFGTVLAATRHLHDRLKKIEGSKAHG